MHIYIYAYISGPLGFVGRLFTNCPGYRGSIPGQVIIKTHEIGT